MKPLIFAIALSAGVPVLSVANEISVPAQNNDIPAPSEKTFETQIERVLLFPRIARITRVATIPAGTQEITLSGFPKNSQAFSATSNISEIKIASISATSRPLSKPTNNADQAKKRLECAKFKYNNLKERVKHIEEQLKKINNAQWLVPAIEKGKTFNVPAAFSLLDYHAKMAQFYNEEIERLQALSHKALIEFALAESEFQNQTKIQKQTEKIVQLKFLEPTRVPAKISVDYFIENATWEPRYDIIVNSQNKTIEMISNAIIVQNSGEDWENVPVELSCANPNFDANLPELEKIIIREKFVLPEPKAFISETGDRINGTSFGASFVNWAAEDVAVEGTFSKIDNPFFITRGNTILQTHAGTRIAVDGVNLQNGLFICLNYDDETVLFDPATIKTISFEKINTPKSFYNFSAQIDNFLIGDLRFSLSKNETLISSETQHRYIIDSKKFDATFSHKIVPAQNLNTYQIATIKNPNFQPLLAGNANIFFDNEFVGTMDFPYTIQNGNAQIPLGIDPRVSVKREEFSFVENVGTFTTSRKKTNNVVIKITNNSNETIRAQIEEAIPRSRQGEIKIENLKNSPRERKFDWLFGKTTWEETIAPAGTLEISTKYEIVYPENFVITED